jgi:hypothetical protein
MHEMKDKMVLRILAQESPKLKLQLKRYGKKNFWDASIIFGKWLGLYLEIHLDSRSLFGSFWTAA